MRLVSRQSSPSPSSASVVGEHREAQAIDAAQWAQHPQAVVQVHQPEQGEGEVVAGKQLQLQAEGHDVRVGARQAAVIGEVAEPAVGCQVGAIDPQVAAQARLRQLAATDLASAEGAQVEVQA
ncbi:hypothetical protein WR25_26945 [Diploscapter pachys]|uniref:Uncharacterized protein n=1 Tax=Diploscapter pachys TaxID=2018661 RepID=A0A2A2M4V6_9BILA|nr:hypothetical protein WR25_26945 [Diploscapter pachys]